MRYLIVFFLIIFFPKSVYSQWISVAIKNGAVYSGNPEERILTAPPSYKNNTVNSGLYFNPTTRVLISIENAYQNQFQMGASPVYYYLIPGYSRDEVIKTAWFVRGTGYALPTDSGLVYSGRVSNSPFFLGAPSGRNGVNYVIRLPSGGDYEAGQTLSYPSDINVLIGAKNITTSVNVPSVNSDTVVSESTMIIPPELLAMLQIPIPEGILNLSRSRVRGGTTVGVEFGTR